MNFINISNIKKKKKKKKKKHIMSFKNKGPLTPPIPRIVQSNCLFIEITKNSN